MDSLHDECYQGSWHCIHKNRDKQRTTADIYRFMILSLLKDLKNPEIN